MDSWGKLGECLFDSSPSMLIPFLCVPTSPIPPEPPLFSPIGSWVGDRIICVGSDGEDYPTDLFTEEELDEAFRSTASDDHALDLDGMITEEYSICKTSYRPPRELCTDDIWVLRNLSKLEYVRADALIVNATQTRLSGPFIISKGYFVYPGLGEVLLSRISWSTSSSAAMSYEGNITRGVWAGDRFDIRTIDSIEDPCNGEHWKDVSEEVAKEIFAIWESEYGLNWKTTTELSEYGDVYT